MCVSQMLFLCLVLKTFVCFCVMQKLLYMCYVKDYMFVWHNSVIMDRLVLRCPPRERKIRGSNPAYVGIFPGSSHTSDLKIGTPVATLPSAWHYRVSVGTSWPGVSIL